MNLIKTVYIILALFFSVNILAAEIRSVHSFGEVAEGENPRHTFIFKNGAAGKIRINGLKVPCCAAAEISQKELAPGGEAELDLVFLSKGLRGKIRKNIYLTTDDSLNPLITYAFEAEVFPASSAVRGTPTSPDAGFFPPGETGNKLFTKNGVKIEFLDYRKNIEKRVESDAWIFAGKTCPGCGLLKYGLLPKLFKKASIADGKVIVVDLDVPENMLLLMKIEEQLEARGDKIPVLLWKDKLVYGNDSIKKFVSEYTPAPLPKEKKFALSEGKESEKLLDRYSEKITLGAVLTAGLLDGINPCVFSTLIFFMTLLAVSKVKNYELLAVGSVYCLSCFLTYFLLGFGLFKAMKAMTGYKLVQQIFNIGLCAALIVLAFLSFRDAFLYWKTRDASSVSLQLPEKTKIFIHSIMKRGLYFRFILPGIFLTGVFVTMLESVCTGQVYVPIILLLIKSGGEETSKWLSYLLLYNLMFIVPLAAIFLAAWKGAGSKTMLDWSRRNVTAGKILLGMFFLFLAAATAWF